MADDDRSRIQTGNVYVPVTIDRPPYNPASKQNKDLPNPGTARANKAATTGAPDGTPQWAYSNNNTNKTVLQQHCSFFDLDGDGVIWPHDTFRGFYALGFGLVLSLLAVLIIHPSFSYMTANSWLPDPFFRLRVENIHKGKHGSDSGTFDNEGRFVPQKFEDWFSKYGKGKDGVTLSDVFEGLKAQRVIMDPFGWFGAIFEWVSTYFMLWPEDGVMKKEDIRRAYDGSIFFDIASERAAGGKKSSKTKSS